MLQSLEKTITRANSTQNILHHTVIDKFSNILLLWRFANTDAKIDKVVTALKNNNNNHHHHNKNDVLHHHHQQQQQLVPVPSVCVRVPHSPTDSGASAGDEDPLKIINELAVGPHTCECHVTSLSPVLPQPEWLPACLSAWPTIPHWSPLKPSVTVHLVIGN